MEPSQSQIPPRLLGDLRVRVASLLERFESPDTTSVLSNPNEIIRELGVVATTANGILERFGRSALSEPHTIDPDSTLGRVLAVQASAQALVVSLMVNTQLPGDTNAQCLYTSSRVLPLQSFERFSKTEN